MNNEIQNKMNDELEKLENLFNFHHEDSNYNIENEMILDFFISDNDEELIQFDIEEEKLNYSLFDYRFNSISNFIIDIRNRKIYQDFNKDNHNFESIFENYEIIYDKKSSDRSIETKIYYLEDYIK